MLGLCETALFGLLVLGATKLIAVRLLKARPIVLLRERGDEALEGLAQVRREVERLLVVVGCFVDAAQLLVRDRSGSVVVLRELQLVADELRNAQDDLDELAPVFRRRQRCLALTGSPFMRLWSELSNED